MPQKILIVDDEPNITVSLKFLMEQNNYEVRTVHNGDDAVQMVDLFEPDLILLDVMMPYKDGFEVCQKLRKYPKWNHIKVILLSAMAKDMDRAKGAAIGADDYITKPFSNAIIIKKVNALLSK